MAIFFISIDLIRSGLFLFVFMILFVGGLLVLLVSLTCVIRQEQSGTLILTGIAMLFIVFIIGSQLLFVRGFRSINSLISWLELNVLVLLLLSYLLGLSLLVIRWALLSYKGITRSACSYSVQHYFFSRNRLKSRDDNCLIWWITADYL